MENQISRIKVVSGDFSNSFENADVFRKIKNITTEKAREELTLIQSVREKANYDLASRDYISFYYLQIIMNMSDEQKADYLSLIDFDTITNNDPHIIFEMLLKHKELSEIIEDNDLNYVITTDDIINLAIKYENEIKCLFESSDTLNNKKFAFIALLLYIYSNGDGAIDSLRYQNVSDVGFTSVNFIYVIINENSYYLKFLTVPSFEDLKQIAQNNTNNLFNMSLSRIVKDKPNGSRVVVVGYENAPSGNLYYNERIFNNKFMSLESLVEKKTISSEIKDLLSFHMKGLGRCLITGSNSNVGKTTLMVSMIDKMDRRHGLGLLDSNDETKLSKRLEDLNVITMLADIEDEADKLLDFFYKQSRRFLSIGEIVTPTHAAQLISLSKSLNSGVISTTFSKSPQMVVKNMVDKMILHKKYETKEQAVDDLIESLDLIIHLDRDQKNPNRVICTGIYEIVRSEPLIISLDMSLEEMQKVILMNKHMIEPYKLVEIVKYDSSLDDWKFLNKPSDEYVSRITKFNEISSDYPVFIDSLFN